jgi:hypothetical protein
LHICPVELSKPKIEADFEHMCVQLFGVAFPKAACPGVTDLDCPKDDVDLMLKSQATLPSVVVIP